MSKRYINQIIRKLKCSKKRREEIKRQLLSEFTSEMENGESEQDIIKRMGKPAEIAEDFNNSFSKEEKKKYKKEKWKKRIGEILSILIVLGVMIWWMLPKQKWIEDSEIYDKEVVLGQAELVVQYLDTDNQEALLVISDETMKKLLEKTNLEEIKAQIGTDWGDRKSVGNVYTVELTQMGKRSAVVQMHVAYENESVMYTISFNQEMEMTGLWLQ